MKKILLFLLSSLFAVEVTFNVDMSDQDVGDEGPTLWMGEFYPNPGFIMADDDQDGVWSYTLDLEPGVYTYKFRNGWWTDWNTGSGWEEVPTECEVGQYGDREVTVSSQNIDIDTVCFNSCSAECVEVIYSTVTFQVDMSDEELSQNDVVYVQGSFNGWCGFCNPMSDVNEDDIWELTLEIPVGEYEYLFTTNGWNGLQGGAPVGSECDYLSSDEFGNYGFSLSETALLLGPYCFGTCWDTCQPPDEVDVTFYVDMNAAESIADNVYMIGNFQLFPWSTSFFPTEMLDDDGDGIYSATVSLQSGQTIEYKFVNGNEVESDEDLGGCGNNVNSTCTTPGDNCNNRELSIPNCELLENGDCVLENFSVDVSSFSSCSLQSVNFSIDLNYSGYPNADYDQCGVNGSWCADGESWPGNCLTLSDDNNDGIFEGSIDGILAGDYEFIVFCTGPADGYSGWGVQLGPEVGSSCDFDSSDEYGNYGFTVVDSDLDVAVCGGSCDETCTDNGDDGGDLPTYSVTFDIDGVDDCEFLSVTGTWDSWSGWGATTDTNMTVELEDGEYEFTILCVEDTSGEWYNDIWGNSIQYSAPVGGSCWNNNDDYPNYIFNVNGSDMTISYCAGSCDETCSAGCNANGDVNADGVLNVVDVVNLVSYVLGSSSLTDSEFCSSDVNEDGTVNVVDIVVIVNIILGG